MLASCRQSARPAGQSKAEAALLVAEYPYQGESGRLLYTIERMSDKQFYPRQPGGSFSS